MNDLPQIGSHESHANTPQLPSERRCLYIASKGREFVPEAGFFRKVSVFRGWTNWAFILENQWWVARNPPGTLQGTGTVRPYPIHSISTQRCLYVTHDHLGSIELFWKIPRVMMENTPKMVLLECSVCHGDGYTYNKVQGTTFTSPQRWRGLTAVVFGLSPFPRIGGENDGEGEGFATKHSGQDSLKGHHTD